jgi:undecaprenyl-diphosphatase
VIAHFGLMTKHKGRMCAKSGDESRGLKVENGGFSATLEGRPSPWWRSPFVLVAATCVGLIYVFAHLASEVVERDTGPFDRAVRDWVFAHRPAWLVSVFGIVTLLGDRRTLFIGAAVVALALARGGARLRPLLIAALPFCLSATARLLRLWFEIPRPPGGLLTSALAFGFPSGHTSGATAVAIVMGYVLARERGARRTGWTIAAVVPLAVGLSRVYLDKHWASDVIGGWLIGGLYAVAVCALYEQALRRSRSK